MKIQFFNTTTYQVDESVGKYCIVDGLVYQISNETYESQSEVLGFDNFIIPTTDIEWRAIN